MMLTFPAAVAFVTLRLLFLFAPTSMVEAVPLSSSSNSTNPVGALAVSSYWLSAIKRQGAVAFGDSSFKVYRNVQDYGATGTWDRAS